MRVLGVRISDEDGSLLIDWYEESEQKRTGGTTYQTIITREALDEWKHIGYYANELREDLTELVGWYTKYSGGTYTDA